MVGTEERRELQETYYTPGRVRYWLEHWAELGELAVPTAGAIRYDKIGQVPDGMKPSDPAKFAAVKADLEGSVEFVSGWWFLARQMTEWMMGKPVAIQGKDYLIWIAVQLRAPVSVANQAWKDICEVIAIDLGWKA